MALTIAASGCDEPAPDLAEWTIADHDHQKEEAPRRRSASAPTYAEPSEKNQVIEVTWLKQCATCHGRKGKGDGPGAVMMQARDFTQSAWQASVSDQQMAEVIRKGRDKMPAFNLPDSIVQGLIEHIRKLEVKSTDNEAEAAGHGATGSPSPTPAPAAAAQTAPAGAQAAQ